MGYLPRNLLVIKRCLTTSDIFLLESLVFKADKVSEIFCISTCSKKLLSSSVASFHYFLVKEGSRWVLWLGQDPLLPTNRIAGR